MTEFIYHKSKLYTHCISVPFGVNGILISMTHGGSKYITVYLATGLQDIRKRATNVQQLAWGS